MPVSEKQIGAAINAIKAIADTIKDLGEVRSGTLYGNLCGLMDLRQFEMTIGILKRGGLVVEKNHLLKWIGPNN